MGICCCCCESAGGSICAGFWIGWDEAPLCENWAGQRPAAVQRTAPLALPTALRRELGTRAAVLSRFLKASTR